MDRWGGSDLRVELDDELFLDRHGDLLANRALVHQDATAIGRDVEPAGHGVGVVGLTRDDERRGLQALGLDVDDVVLADLERRDVRLHAVDQEVTVGHQLAGVTTRAGQAGTVDDVVQAALEQAEQVVTGLAGTARGQLVVLAELLLEDAVGVARLLLLLSPPTRSTP